MNPTMLNAYPVGYSLANDIKYTGRDRPYEYLERTNSLGTNMLDQSMNMGASNSMDYKYSSSHLQQDGSCNTTNSQSILTPPQTNDDPPPSITNPPSSSFSYSTLPKVSASNAASLDYYPAATTSFLPPTFNGATMTQADRRPASLHMAPMSPPYNYGHTYTPYSMNRAAMPEFTPFPAPRNTSYDNPFHRGGPRVTSLPGPFASNLLPFTSSMTQNSQHHTEGPPFAEVSTICSLVNSHHQNLNLDIIANIPKGFFKVDDKWTCYRRNYFSVTCGFTFKSHNLDGRVFLQRHAHSSLEQVHGYALSISAKTAAPNNSESEPRGLVQHTPKRDKATETTPSRQLASPTPTGGLMNGHSMPQNGVFPSHMGPCASSGLEGFGQAASQSPSTQVTFDRIQFQKATANNGKRRAQQQYFHVVVRLEVNVSRPGMQDDWVLVASRESSPMVVRGRSPGHYKDNRRDSQTSMDPDAGSGHHGEGGGGMSGYSLHPIGSSHPTGLGSAPGSYRHSHHYGTSFNHSSHRVEESESSSTSRGSSVTLPPSPNKGIAHQSTYNMGRNNLQGVCFDRIALSPMLSKPDTDQMEYHHSKKRGREGEHVDHYYQSTLETSTYGNPSFDFSATSSQALCASS